MKLKQVLIVAKKSRPQVAKVLQALTEELAKRGIEWLQVEPAWYKLSSEEVLSDFDVHYRHEAEDVWDFWYSTYRD
ncbi:hypothetical protein [Thermospira aquatica]|uniref:Uncharacterized protein n=1 Tax=Thermospira aquatica TaxID=2828656 RepID=A0AAX3BDX6_9SPIR|nr:hypothetical protein [Thermospira aquatica]URA10300.1 hypothetical protein KDW03_00400 [Thermospira aquatica]